MLLHIVTLCMWRDKYSKVIMITFNFTDNQNNLLLLNINRYSTDV